MFVQSVSRTVFAVLWFLPLTALQGCEVAHPPTHEQRRAQEQAELADAPLPVLPQPDIDDVAHVIEACGQPELDSVAAIYSKDYNGPVRRLRYGGRRPIELNFISSRPRAELAYGEAPLPRAERPAPQLPPHATWRFQDARLEKEVMITSHRLAAYLPCAGLALRGEF
jgi:hypothetical protein